MVTKEVGEEVGGLKKLVPTGTCVLIEGLLAETPEGTKQVCSTSLQQQQHAGRSASCTYGGSSSGTYNGSSSRSCSSSRSETSAAGFGDTMW